MKKKAGGEVARPGTQGGITSVGRPQRHVCRPVKYIVALGRKLLI